MNKYTKYQNIVKCDIHQVFFFVVNTSNKCFFVAKTSNKYKHSHSTFEILIKGPKNTPMPTNGCPHGVLNKSESITHSKRRNKYFMLLDLIQEKVPWSSYPATVLHFWKFECGFVNGVATI